MLFALVNLYVYFFLWILSFNDGYIVLCFFSMQFVLTWLIGWLMMSLKSEPYKVLEIITLSYELRTL